MKSSTYKWIIGCLSGVIVILVAVLVTKEIGIIRISFSECLSLSATLSSLILSIVAMLYTYYSGRDSANIYGQIKSSVKEIDTKVLQISEEAKANSEALRKINDAMSDIEKAVLATSQVLDTLQQDQLTEQEKKAAIESIQNTKNSMLMFLNRMK